MTMHTIHKNHAEQARQRQQCIYAGTSSRKPPEYQNNKNENKTSKKNHVRNFADAYTTCTITTNMHTKDPTTTRRRMAQAQSQCTATYNDSNINNTTTAAAATAAAAAEEHQDKSHKTLTPRTNTKKHPDTHQVSPRS
jgi:hypothetical protein